MNKMQILLKRHSSTILTVISALGVVGTTILAVKATPKAIELIENAKKEKQEDLTKLESIRVAWKPYISTAISGISTIACIFSANYLNLRNQASLMSAYALLSNSYQEYVEKTKELSTNDEKTVNVMHGLVKSKFDQNIILDEDKKLFFDFQSMRYFDSTLEDVLKAEDMVNQQFAATDCVSLNDFYRYLGIEPIEQGDYIGWMSDGHYYEILFNHERVQLDGGIECCLITMEFPQYII